MENTAARAADDAASDGGGIVAGLMLGAGVGEVGVGAENEAPNGEERVSTSGGGVINFQDCEEDDEDCSWLVPEVAAPKVVWQGHLGPVARISSCSHTPCFFTLGEVEKTKYSLRHTGFFIYLRSIRRNRFVFIRGRRPSLDKPQFVLATQQIDLPITSCSSRYCCSQWNDVVRNGW